MSIKMLFRSLCLSPLLLTGCVDPNQQSVPEDGRSYQSAETPVASTDKEGCFIPVVLRQKRISLNIENHIKDAWNKTGFYMPVACDKAEELKKGDELFASFRAGSLLMDGSIGANVLYVADEPIIPANPDRTVCRTRLTLKQERISLDLGQHIKDGINTQKFDWDMPCVVYDEMHYNHELLDERFRVGSLVLRGTISGWSLKVSSKKGPV